MDKEAYMEQKDGGGDTVFVYGRQSVAGLAGRRIHANPVSVFSEAKSNE
jgi:hypothetical protein